MSAIIVARQNAKSQGLSQINAKTGQKPMTSIKARRMFWTSDSKRHRLPSLNVIMFCELYKVSHM